MLRLPKFELSEPTTVAEVIAQLVAGGDRAQIIAGGTDLVPNMKHGLFEPELVVSLERVEALRGIRAGSASDEPMVIGAMTRISEVAASELVRERAPALAQAASLIAGPQLRTMGTLGGNVMLDTRCQWYNQTYFWRKSLGFCLKKDGELCHVVAGGKKCVAAASNDSAPALMTLGATLLFVGPDGEREVAISDLWKADGIVNKKTLPHEVLTEIRIPAQAPGHRGAYGKLRDRESIDFPLLGVAARIDLDANGKVADADMVVVALAARPVRLKKVAETLAGTTPGEDDFVAAARAVAEAAFKQCHPLANIPGDDDYRREMVRVYVRRTLLAAADGSGPVHAV
ncbi:MAG: 4-hydroxybenzoyl-CoA reductase subunit beta [Chlamydiales bacterium]|jgi:4-hydroxybenzoyl-CoA reductase subunit beta